MRDPKIRASQQSKDFPDSFHRVAIKGLYVREGGVLLCHDFVIPNRDPVWELPGGGLDFGESIPDALKREVKEEMNLEVTWVADKPTYVWVDRKENHRGIEWWYALLLLYRFDVKSLDDFVPSDECREIKFFSKEELEQATDLNGQTQPLAKLFNPEDFKAL